MVGNSASLAASFVRNAARTRRSAAMMSGRRASNDVGNPGATGAGQRRELRADVDLRRRVAPEQQLERPARLAIESRRDTQLGLGHVEVRACFRHVEVGDSARGASYPDQREQLRVGLRRTAPPAQRAGAFRSPDTSSWPLSPPMIGERTHSRARWLDTSPPTPRAANGGVPRDPAPRIPARTRDCSRSPRSCRLVCCST